MEPRYVFLILVVCSGLSAMTGALFALAMYVSIIEGHVKGVQGRSDLLEQSYDPSESPDTDIWYDHGYACGYSALSHELPDFVDGYPEEDKGRYDKAWHLGWLAGDTDHMRDVMYLLHETDPGLYPDKARTKPPPVPVDCDHEGEDIRY